MEVAYKRVCHEPKGVVMGRIETHAESGVAQGVDNDGVGREMDTTHVLGLVGEAEEERLVGLLALAQQRRVHKADAQRVAERGGSYCRTIAGTGNLHRTGLVVLFLPMYKEFPALRHGLGL